MNENTTGASISGIIPLGTRWDRAGVSGALSRRPNITTLAWPRIRLLRSIFARLILSYSLNMHLRFLCLHGSGASSKVSLG